MCVVPCRVSCGVVWSARVVESRAFSVGRQTLDARRNEDRDAPRRSPGFSCTVTRATVVSRDNTRRSYGCGTCTEHCVNCNSHLDKTSASRAPRSPRLAHLLHASASLAELCVTAMLLHCQGAARGSSCLFQKEPPSACAFALLACCWTYAGPSGRHRCASCHVRISPRTM